MPAYDVIVLGVGGVGSAALLHTARRGAKVLGIDRFPPGHDRGSSHGDTRLIRQAYFEHPDYVPLVQRAYQLWEELEQTVDRPLYTECGILEAGPPEGSIVSGVRDSARRHNLHVEDLSPSEVSRRFPGFQIPDGMHALYEPRAGFLRVEECVVQAGEAAIRAGAELRTGETIIGWSADASGVVVTTDRARYSAKSLILSPGAWASHLLQDLGVAFTVVRKSLYWFETLRKVYAVGQGGVGFIVETPAGDFYGFPEIDAFGLKVAEHTRGLPVSDPLSVDRSEDPAETSRVIEFASQCLPAVSSRKTRFATCLYTLSPDRNFVVDRHPEWPHVAFAAGLSGHGFKFASVLGEVLSDWATQGVTNQPVEFLRLGRPSLRTPPKQVGR